MSLRQLKVKYSGAKLGIWWAVITPLVLAIGINFIFSNVFKINIPNYTLLVLAGIIPWLFFSNSLTEVAQSFIISSHILKQAIFPREFIPLSTVLANFLSFLIGFLFLIPLFIVSKFQITLFLPFLLFLLIFQLIFTLGLGLILSLLNLFFRDLSHFLPIIFMVWFWITPIFYTLEMLPPRFRWICLSNPLTYFTISYQDILFKGSFPSTLFICFLLGIFSFIIGYIIFIKYERVLLKRI